MSSRRETRDHHDLVIAGGKVVNATGSLHATVLIDDGRVTALLEPDHPIPTADRVIEAAGQLVIPGGVDPHCHVGQALGEFTMLDDHQKASIAALWGGTTTIIDFAIPEPGQTPLMALHEKLKVIEGSRADIALHGGVISWDSTTREQLRAMAELGVLTVKMFTTYRDGVMAGYQTIEQVMRELSELGGVTMIHAEENHAIEKAQDDADRAGFRSAAHHAGTRPEHAEVAAVSRTLHLAERTGAAVYFVHQSTPDVIDLVAAAQARGVRAYSETCPHYFTLDDSVYGGPHPERFVCCPPIRSELTMTEVRKRSRTGFVDTVGSDHCCYSTAQKLRNAHDVREMPNGLPGVEHRLTVTFDTLVVAGGMSIERFVALTSTNPASLNGLRGKGWIGVGADADVVVFDPAASETVSASSSHMNSDYSPYEGMTFTGWPTTVISGGRVVVDENGFHDPGPVGKFVPSKSQLDSGVRLVSRRDRAANETHGPLIRDGGER